MPTTLLARITYFTFTAICFVALWKGDTWQRVAGGVLLCANIITPLIQDRLDWMDPKARFFTEDLVVLICLAGLAIHVGKTWTILCAAFQLDSTLSHPASHYFHVVGGLAYIAMVEVFSWGAYVTLAVAVLLKLSATKTLTPAPTPT